MPDFVSPHLQVLDQRLKFLESQRNEVQSRLREVNSNSARVEEAIYSQLQNTLYQLQESAWKKMSILLGEQAEIQRQIEQIQWMDEFKEVSHYAPSRPSQSLTHVLFSRFCRLQPKLWTRQRLSVSGSATRQCVQRFTLNPRCHQWMYKQTWNCLGRSQFVVLLVTVAPQRLQQCKMHRRPQCLPSQLQ